MTNVSIYQVKCVQQSAGFVDVGIINTIPTVFFSGLVNNI